MKRAARLFCTPVSWKNRRGYVLGNELVRLVTLLGGGHIAEFRFHQSSGFSVLNPLWEPPWKLIDPNRFRPHDHVSRYGPVTNGAKLLAGIVGHNICLDFFGVPSPEEYATGLSDHGEAPNLRWGKLKVTSSDRQVTLKLGADLPAAGLLFTRTIRLMRQESVAYFEEVVTNRRKLDHFFHWVQHVTLGPPYLSASETSVSLPGTKGRTAPAEYEAGRGLLSCGREFRWPYAPSVAGKRVDLRRVLSKPGQGFVAGVLIDPRRDVGFVTALNSRHHLLIGYCFQRSDYPWVTLWEENRTITARPWKGRTETRGLEFGTTPLGLRRRDSCAMGSLFGTPTFNFVPSYARRTVRYAAFLVAVPHDFHRVKDIRVEKSHILVFDETSKAPAIVPAKGLAHWNWDSRK